MFNHCFGEHKLVRPSNRKHKFVHGDYERKELGAWRLGNFAKYWPKEVNQVDH